MTVGARIVLVDDHEMLSEALSIFLTTKLHADVITVGSLQSARAVCATMIPRLLLIDRGLPDGNGFHWARDYRKNLPGTRWLGITSSDDAATARDVINAGLNGWITKFCNLETIRIAIETLLAGHSFYCARGSQALQQLNYYTRGELLTEREIEIVRALAAGKLAKEIASDLNLSAKTVQNHLSNIKEKLKIRSTIGIIQAAWERGWIQRSFEAVAI